MLFVSKTEDAEILRKFQLLFRVILYNLENESDAKVGVKLESTCIYILCFSMVNLFFSSFCMQ